MAVPADLRSDLELLDAADHGDEEAFWEFCVRFIPSLVAKQRAHCLRYGVPVDLAEDFAHETLIRAVNWLRSDRTGQLSRNFLFIIARNVILDWYRHHRVEKHRFRGDLIDEVVDERNYSRGSADVMEYFHKLSPMDREILQLVLLESYSPAEAAARLRIQVWSAYKRYERALRRLRDMLRR